MLRHTALAALVATASFAGTPATPPATPAPEAAWGDSLWKHAVLWEDPENYWFQKVRAMLRYHTNYAYVSEDDLGSAGDFETRRLRFGINAEFLQQFEFRNEWNSIGWDDDVFDPEISNIDTLFLSWKPSKAFQLIVGKHKAPLTQEFRSSSNELLTVERTIITQSFVPIERNWGVSMRGESGRWAYLAGLWASTFEGDYNIGFDSGGPSFLLTSLGYDFGGADRAWSRALLTLQYAHTDQPGQVGPKFENITSLNFEGKAGRFGLQADFLAGWGAQDAYGAYFIPTWDITKDVQLVARYSFGKGDADTIALRNRYEGLLTKGRGDQYHSIYAGVNYYLYGHKLKWQTGVEYENVKDATGGEGRFKGVTFETSFVFWF